jgi:hypothetical protein
MKSPLRSKLSVLVQRRLQVERRGGKRVRPIHRTVCLFQTSDGSERGTGLVQNLAYKGLAMQAERDYPLGTLLHVLLVNEAHTFSVALEMKVARSFRVAGDHYLVAGPFARALRHEEMLPFIV